MNRKNIKVFILSIVVGLIVGLSAVFGYYIFFLETSDSGINSSWFEGTWLNHLDYDDATVELYFSNVFGDVVIYTREKGETYWSNPEISGFGVFYSKELYSRYQNYVLYLELPLNSNIYLCTIWDGPNDMFEIYYGSNEHMRFYRVHCN